VEIISDITAMQAFAKRTQVEGKTIALVPTMGFLHQGHVSLMKEGRSRGDYLVISIFVNPTQFGAGEDFEDYPRDMARDRALAQEAGVDVIFAPQAADMYPAGYQTHVEVENVTQNLCGLSRPTHFKGVTTVVCKLFCIVKPNCAIFGEKDFQQLVVIRQMVADLNFDIEVVGMPIYREEDGLAMSSRNRYLKPDERKAALCIVNALRKAKALFDAGEREGKKIVSLVKNGIGAEPLSRIDYIKICDASTIKDIDQITEKSVLAVAVNIGKARLIDNVVLDPLTARNS
jgi:pantoate--beta-alanine ligase